MTPAAAIPQPGVELHPIYPHGELDRMNRCRLDINTEHGYDFTGWPHIRVRYTLEVGFIKSHLLIWKNAKRIHDERLRKGGADLRP